MISNFYNVTEVVSCTNVDRSTKTNKCTDEEAQALLMLKNEERGLSSKSSKSEEELKKVKIEEGELANILRFILKRNAIK